jgi:hypothetical protein
MDSSHDMLADNVAEAERRPKLVEIKVNGTSFNVPKGLMTFTQVVALVFPDAGSNPQNIYSVTYKNADNEKKPEGVLVAGASVKVKEGTRFRVSQTGQS